MKHTIWLPLLSLVLMAVVPVRADTDGRFLGRAIQFDGKKKPATLPAVDQPPPRPLPLPEPRPAPLPAISLPIPPHD